MSIGRYAYGDSDVAAERLAIVAKVLEPSTREFLSEFGTLRPRVAVDLGCGPGHSTRLVSEVLRPEHAIGLDGSDRFVELARADAWAGLSFRRHDVTIVPFPTGPADFIFSRLLLSHLPFPTEMLARWGTQIRPGGGLLVAELEFVRTEEPAFREYLDLAEAVVARGGGNLWVGTMLEASPSPVGLRRESSRMVAFRPVAEDVARIFAMNLRVLRDDEYVRERWRGSKLLNLEAAIYEAGERGAGTTWAVRQIAFRRV